VSEQYSFPEVYVAGVQGKKCLCDENGKYVVVPCAGDLGFCVKVYGSIPYEQALNYIDLLEARVRVSMAILQGKPGEAVYEGFLLERGVNVCLQEILGNHMYLYVKEGMSIEREHTIAHVITGKLEIRSIRSTCEGLVALVVDMPWEEPRKAVVVVTNVYRPVTARKGT